MNFNRRSILLGAFWLGSLFTLHAQAVEPDDNKKFAGAGFPAPYSGSQAGRAVQSFPQSREPDFKLAPPRRQVARLAPSSSALGQNLTDATITANIYVETDYELFFKLGSTVAGVQNYVANLLTAVSNVYKRDANIVLRASTIRVATSAVDPWTATTPNGMLDEVKLYWSSAPEVDFERAAVLFLSGKTTDAGIAYVDAICHKTPGVANYDPYDIAIASGLTGIVNNVAAADTWDVIVVAHELGHTFGSHHTHCTAKTGGGGYYDMCENGEPSTGTHTCYAGTEVSTYGSIMSYCHQHPPVDGTGGSGMKNMNPLSFLNAANDPAIKNVIRGGAEQWTTQNRSDGCLATSYPLQPTYMPGILNLLTD